METQEILLLRRAAQVALLGMITQDIRAISFEFNNNSKHLIFRVHFDAEPHEIVIENMSSVLTEIEAGLPFHLSGIKEEYLVLSPPIKPDYLNIVVYSRCESADFLPPPNPSLNTALKRARYLGS